MQVHRSNHAEELLRALAATLERPLQDPFAPECIVVQGPGMQRWLSQELSQALSVFAHAEFVFPRKLLERAFALVLGEVRNPGIDFEPETLMWSVAELLPERLEEAGFEPIRGYLTGESSGEKLIQLAQRIAATLDHYVIYRPEMVLAWESGDVAAAARWSGPGAEWQAELWRALVARHGKSHLAARTRSFLQQLGRSGEALAELPERISLFGIPTLPPLYMACLAALAERVEVNLFVLSPSREYWGEIRSERERLRELRRSGADAEESEASLHLAEGNPLLASLGRLGRDFQQLLEGEVDYLEDERDLYRDPLGGPPEAAAPAASVLRAVQSDILHLRHRGGSDGEVAPLPLAENDRSISVHSCHGRMREAEVLRDQLLDLFESDPSLEPRDVVVMTPDAEAYAPYVEAVFGGEGAGSGDRDGLRIPCRFGDRSARRAYPLVEGFWKLLDVLEGRMKASELLDLLGTDCIRDRFGFEAGDEPLLHEWVQGAGIRWGVDREHRASQGQPAVPENTWRFGLERLLLGHAFEGHESRHFAGRLPFDDVEGAGAAGVGRLADFCETLFGLRDRVQKPLSPDGWRALLGEMLERMIARTPDTEHQHQLIRDELDALAERAARAGYSGLLSLRSVREQLDRALSGRVPTGGFLTGGVTFCELVPMRTIPFRVVCLMGMNDDAFPRIRRPVGFDLIARRRMLGDRSSRDDDRYLFLEALLSTRDRLIITYVGQDILDNAPLPPSVVVGELLDHLGDAFSVGAGGATRDPVDRVKAQKLIRERLVVAHPLQPFSSRYFDPAAGEPALFSYSTHACEAARVLLAEDSPPEPFLKRPLAPPDEPLEEVSLRDLIDFFRSPARGFLRRRLGLLLGDDRRELEDREPLALAGLEEWRVGDALLEGALAGRSREDTRLRFAAQGELPLGVPGQCVFDEIAARAEPLAARVLALRQSAPLPDLELDRRVGEVRVSGTLRDLWPGGRVTHQYSRLGSWRELACWIEHVALCSMLAARDRMAETPAVETLPSPFTHLVGRPERGDGPVEIAFRPIEQPERLLASLVDLYVIGHQTALPLFPKTSRRYVEKLGGGGEDRESQAIQDAYLLYRGSGFQTPECEDPYVRQAFSQVDPLAPGYCAMSPDPRQASSPGASGSGSEGNPLGFRALASRVFGPMLAHREKVK